MTSYLYQSATAIARAIRERKVTSAEVVDQHLARIDAVNPALNAVVVVSADQARADAQAADQALQDDAQMGPLHGVPVTIKDCFDVAGLVTTGGTLGRANFVADSDATAVARLRNAGAVILGKTNCPEFCLAFETDNLIYGRTNNPYDVARVAGGSSGGEGAILAAGGSALGLGTDGGGSIRVPSHCNGTAGLKPTTGRIPTTGAWPPFAGILEATNAAGPMARYVEDLILALPVLAGPDGHDPMVTAMPVLDPDEVELPGLRIAVHTDDGIVTPESAVIDAVTAAAGTLSDAGAAMTEARPTGIEAAPDLFMGIYSSDQAKIFRDYLAQAGTTEPHPMLDGTLNMFSGNAMSGEDVARLLLAWGNYRRSMLEFFQDYDAILCPANAYAPLPHGQTVEHILGYAYTFAYNLTGWPGAVVRGGTAPGNLPIGVQVLAHPWREDVALAVARQIEAASGGWQAPPL
jgi:amidase